MAKSSKKLFIVRKYVWAETAQEAIHREKKQGVDDVWVDEDFKAKQRIAPPVDAIGFEVEE